MWNNKDMAAYLILILAVLSRFLPHVLHTSAWGVTAMGGGLLFFGSRLGRASRWQTFLAILAIALSDWALTTRVYGFPFHTNSYLITWAWYALVCLAGSAWLHRRRNATRVTGAALASSTGFFLLSNGLVWLSGTMYPHTAAGLAQCYAAGVPFYRNDALSTLTVCGILFGLPALAQRLNDFVESRTVIS